MSRTGPACLLVAALAGCAGPLTSTLPEYRPGGPLGTRPVPESTVYALYRVADAGDRPTHVLCGQVQLHKGCELGFDRSSDDRPRAVAGRDSFPLAAEGAYRWETEGPTLRRLMEMNGWSSGYSEHVRAGLERTGSVVAAPFIAAGTVGVFLFLGAFRLPELLFSPFRTGSDKGHVAPEPPLKESPADVGQPVVDGVEKPQPPQVR
jgi:hypothetical protein